MCKSEQNGHQLIEKSAMNYKNNVSVKKCSFKHNHEHNTSDESFAAYEHYRFVIPVIPGW